MSLTRRQLLQSHLIPIKRIRVAAVPIRIIELPNSIIRPTAGRGTSRGAIPSQDEGVRINEGARVARAALPPGRVGVEERVPPRAGMVRVAEVLDPRHRRAGGQRAVALEV